MSLNTKDPGFEDMQEKWGEKDQRKLCYDMDTNATTLISYTWQKTSIYHKRLYFAECKSHKICVKKTLHANTIKTSRTILLCHLWWFMAIINVISNAPNTTYTNPLGYFEWVVKDCYRNYLEMFLLLNFRMLCSTHPFIT